MTDIADRRTALGILARSPAGLLAERMARIETVPAYTWLRKPETGTLMLRGRIGGDGELFNVGEATLTRCTLRTDDGTVGVGTVLGRNAAKAEQVALCDALLQRPATAASVLSEVIGPLAEAEYERQAREAAEVAASRVDFFTLVRGED
ncbi:MAG: phosphonate C-P lyase system protein PhnG [Rhodocyclales bacterium]|nr:phosphonate C-P lyase system protein PhnG [Rhodocyclales bacterium]